MEYAHALKATLERMRVEGRWYHPVLLFLISHLHFSNIHVQECLEAIIANNECTSLVLSIAEKTDDTFRQVQIVLETCLHEHNLLQKTVEEMR